LKLSCLLIFFLIKIFGANSQPKIKYDGIYITQTFINSTEILEFIRFYDNGKYHKVPLFDSTLDIEATKEWTKVEYYKKRRKFKGYGKWDIKDSIISTRDNVKSASFKLDIINENLLIEKGFNSIKKYLFHPFILDTLSTTITNETLEKSQLKITLDYRYLFKYSYLISTFNEDSISIQYISKRPTYISYEVSEKFKKNKDKDTEDDFYKYSRSELRRFQNENQIILKKKYDYSDSLCKIETPSFISTVYNTEYFTDSVIIYPQLAIDDIIEFVGIVKEKGFGWSSIYPGPSVTIEIALVRNKIARQIIKVDELLKKDLVPITKAKGKRVVPNFH
jgi:hypothetical protein